MEDYIQNTYNDLGTLINEQMKYSAISDNESEACLIDLAPN